MLVLSKEEVYVTDIITHLEKINFSIVEGTLYPLLSRLKKEGLLTYVWKESHQWPPRKYYSLAKTGQEELKKMKEERWLLQSSISELID